MCHMTYTWCTIHQTKWSRSLEKPYLYIDIEGRTSLQILLTTILRKVSIFHWSFQSLPTSNRLESLTIQIILLVSKNSNEYPQNAFSQITKEYSQLQCIHIYRSLINKQY